MILITMESDLKDSYKNLSRIIKGSVIDLSDIEIFNSWLIVMICLLLIERLSNPNKKLLLPKNTEAKKYLKIFCLNTFLTELGFANEVKILNQLNIPQKDNYDIQPLMHCPYRDDFNAKLGYFLLMFMKFGLSQNDSARATALIGELGNNVFDHNLGNWPTNIGGCLIAIQNYPDLQKIEITVGDPGVGFLGSLKIAFPEISNDIDAIKGGLTGQSGRLGEKRGNGLKLIQQWTIENFFGKFMVHSGDGLVIVDKNGAKDYSVNRILGTLTQSVINYKKELI